MFVTAIAILVGVVVTMVTPNAMVLDAATSTRSKSQMYCSDIVFNLLFSQTMYGIAT